MLFSDECIISQPLRIAKRDFNLLVLTLIGLRKVYRREGEQFALANIDFERFVDCLGCNLLEAKTDPEFLSNRSDR